MNRYEIRIRSLLDPKWQEVFAVEQLTHDALQGETLLGGTLDQPQLQGILGRIHDMGLQLVAVKMIEGDENGRLLSPPEEEA